MGKLTLQSVVPTLHLQSVIPSIRIKTVSPSVAHLRLVSTLIGPQGPTGATGATGSTGATGAAGADGDNAYVYIAYASDASGTDFTTTFDANLDYIAIKATDTEIVTPAVGDFAGLWKNYKGATGNTGATGSTGAAGADGATWTSGATDPDNGNGANGDFYLQTGTGATGVLGDVWLKAAGSWSINTNIRGPAGTGSVSTGTTPVVSNNLAKYTGTDGTTIDDSGIAVGDVVTGSSTDTFTNKTFDANGTGNSLSNVETADIAAGSKTGADPDLVTGTAGTNGNLAMWNTDGDLVDGSVVAANVLVDGDIGTSVQAFDADTLKADTADVLTAGFATTVFNAGTQSGAGTYTPNEANGNFQRAVNGGAHTFAPPTNDCNIVVQYTNDASAGAITTSGFTIVTGDTLTTTNGDDFLFYVTKINGFSHLNVVALQ